jgi:hypothetical protein
MVVPAPATTVTWNPSDADSNLTFSGGNLVVSDTISAWSTVRATLSKSSGRRYFEVTLTTIGPGNVGGVAITGGSLNNNIGALGVSSVGADPPGLTFFSEGAFTPIAGATPSFANGDVLGIAIDLDSGKLWFSKNGSYTVFNAGADPASGVNYEYTFTTPLTLFPAASLFGTTSMTLAASGTFVTAPPSGFVSWNA